jgi:hypothetical protein
VPWAQARQPHKVSTTISRKRKQNRIPLTVIFSFTVFSYFFVSSV